MSLSLELQTAKEEIERYAREFGLDFFETIFEVLDFDQLNEVAAYGGFPTRYPHWRFGMEYDQLAKGYAYGLQKIYELVINNDPCYAYLMKSNSLVDQKLVMAHVFAHCDFFKNNCWFAHTDRKMMDRMANHGTAIRKIADRVGLETVEDFVDKCLSLDNLIDIHAPHIRRERPRGRARADDEESSAITYDRLPSKSYMDRFINPPTLMRARAQKQREGRVKRKKSFPPEPRRDVLKFLLDYAPLERWEQEILDLVRQEAYYFAPQAQTKIMNEGWASYWHSTIMTRKVLTDAEVVDFADHHAGTMGTRPGRLNPYKLGIELFRNIEERWNRGQFGKEWEECDDYEARRRWDKRLGGGRQKIFEVRRTHNDVTFIDAFLTEEFCQEQKLFVYRVNPKTGRQEIAERGFAQVKESLLFGLTNFGQPFIYVVDGNWGNRGELLLVHGFGGVELQLDEAGETLRNLQAMWRRPVHIQTFLDGKPILLSHDGTQLTTQEGEPVLDPPAEGDADDGDA
ncbi:MAG: SpoVR family protein [Planctomycetota bacterium]